MHSATLNQTATTATVSNAGAESVHAGRAPSPYRLECEHEYGNSYHDVDGDGDGITDDAVPSSCFSTTILGLQAMRTSRGSHRLI